MIQIKFFKRSVLQASIALIASSAATADEYVADPSTTPELDDIKMFEEVLGLTETGPRSGSLLDDTDNMGLSVTQRRDLIVFEPNATPAPSIDNDLNSIDGSLDGYVYKYLNASNTISGSLTLGSGTSGSSSNLPLILDLGESTLIVDDTLQTQGAIFLSTVNSNASSGGAEMDGLAYNDSVQESGLDAMSVDLNTTGHITTDQLFDLGSSSQKLPANFKLLMDLNSSLKNGTDFVFLEETGIPESAEVDFDFKSTETTSSTLFDTSYVINSSAKTQYWNGSGWVDVDPNSDAPNRQRIVVTFNRDDNEYITKSYTDNHPSNDAALKLGTIAADGVALGDMQTVLTRLDINDFGYGNNAENLAVQVKRLAPIANNSLLISQFDGVRLVTGAIDYRIDSRRGNWSGNSDLDNSLWIKALASDTNSSGSVPVATETAQDTAGHDGFETRASGFVIGYDKTFNNGVLGVSMADLESDLTQLDDRVDEDSVIAQRVWSVYGQVHGKADYLSVSLKHGLNNVSGERKTAIDRAAHYDYDSSTSELALKYGHRFDLSDGRSAITPYVRYIKTRNSTPEYTETDAGALSLNVHKSSIVKETAELGLSASHKGRFSGVKALTVLHAAVGKDVDISDLTVSANYTGATDTEHADYTSFTTPAETWADNYVSLGANLQLEAKKGLLVKLGANGELRQSRQNYSADLSLIWAF